MNTKRQTIWLVSMLSLMVVLSAYYLFTEDVNKLNATSEKVQQEDIKVTTELTDPHDADQAVTGAGQGADKTAQQVADSTSDAAQSASTQTEDAKVLEKLQSAGKSGTEFFEAQYMKRNEDLYRQVDQLLAVTSDTKKSTDEIAKASEELDKIQTKQAKVENIEDILAKDFKNAIVLEEGSKFKVVVQADKLERSQAQTIIDLMIKELNVSKDYISVQYMH